MGQTTRRGFLGVVGAGAAAAGVAAVPTAAFARPEPEQEQFSGQTDEAGAAEPVVAYVRDARSDAVSLMVGEREEVVHNRDLVTRILNAAGR